MQHGNTITIGQVDIFLDPENHDWHIDARPGYKSRELKGALKQAHELGMDVYSPEECEAGILDDGTIRIWMSPKEPV
ncbi:hypothetical protein [Micromonospora sp. CB01531]|uniref:hypothetical protein n=1 Tax=Micromonospora sp. CB01531 TaxID=1718947 RepID=UPI00093D6790|nr:hypothetical protein [Micromonospora sp. CB01531]OKI45124.1 hypothetical protein A6A27_11970 [Micromonospora sp. CB01531]